MTTFRFKSREDSKEENKWERANEELGRLQAGGLVGVEGGVWVAGEMRRELRAGPRPPLKASSDSHHHPCHQWRFPGRAVSMECRTLSASPELGGVVSSPSVGTGGSTRT